MKANLEFLDLSLKRLAERLDKVEGTQSVMMRALDLTDEEPPADPFAAAFANFRERARKQSGVAGG